MPETIKEVQSRYGKEFSQKHWENGLLDTDEIVFLKDSRKKVQDFYYNKHQKQFDKEHLIKRENERIGLSKSLEYRFGLDETIYKYIHKIGNAREKLKNYPEHIAVMQLYINVSTLGNSVKINGILGTETTDAMMKWKLPANDYRALLDKSEAAQKKQEHKKVLDGLNLSQKDKETLADKKLRRMSDQEFEAFFVGEHLKQMNIGDCWLIATMDSLASFGGFKDLIKKSIYKTGDGFIITLPLGSPSGTGTSYHITFENNVRQLSIKGEALRLGDAEIGIDALMIAYGRYVTGKERFDWQTLQGGYDGPYFNNLIYGINSYAAYRKEEDIIAQDGLNSGDDYGFIDELKIALSSFNAETDMLVLSVNQLRGKDQSGNQLLNKLGDWHGSNHAISVEKTFMKGNELFVSLSNPWDAEIAYSIPFTELLKSCDGYTLGTTRKLGGLMPYENNTKGKKTISNDVEDESWSSSPKAEKELASLNQIIQLAGLTKEDQRISRGDVIVSKKGYGSPAIYSVESRGKYDTFLTFDHDGNPSISIGNKTLYLPKNTFSVVFANNTDPKYQEFLYPPRVSVFINKLRHDYIDKKMGAPGDLEPFKLEDGVLTFHADPSKYASGRDQIVTTMGTVNVLEDWDLLGILDLDTVAKEMIKNFLNDLYKE